jgi:hypothetical protein
LRSALAFAESHKLNTWYFKLERTIGELEKTQREQERQATRATEYCQAPILDQMEAGLREYAALQSA